MLEITSAVLFLGIALIIQTTIASQITLLEGPTNLVFLTYISWVLRAEVSGQWQWSIIAGLMVGFASELPVWLPVSTYLLINALIQLVKSRIWELPAISLLATTLIGTMLILTMQWIFLFLGGTSISIGAAFNLVILPSTILNLLLAFPIYALMGEVTVRFYPPQDA